MSWFPCQAVVAGLKSDVKESRTELRPLKPTPATSNAGLAATNLLHELDTAAQDLISDILDAQVRLLLIYGTDFFRLPLRNGQHHMCNTEIHWVQQTWWFVQLDSMAAVAI